MPKEQVEVKIARLEQNHKALSDVVVQIRDNHLVHISADIKEVKDQVDRISLKLAQWGGVILLLGVIGQILVDKYFK